MGAVLAKTTAITSPAATKSTLITLPDWLVIFNFFFFFLRTLLDCPSPLAMTLKVHFFFSFTAPKTSDFIDLSIKGAKQFIRRIANMTPSG